jgi:hypothetical protein
VVYVPPAIYLRQECSKNVVNAGLFPVMDGLFRLEMLRKPLFKHASGNKLVYNASHLQT